MSEAHVNGTIHAREESTIINALLPMFGGYNNKIDLELEADGLDVSIYRDGDKFFLSGVVLDRTPGETSALVRKFGQQLEAARISYSLELQQEDQSWERFEWTP